MGKRAILFIVVLLLGGVVWSLLRSIAPAPNTDSSGEAFPAREAWSANPEVAEPPVREGIEGVAKESADRSELRPDALEVSVFDEEGKRLSGATVALYAIGDDERLFESDFQAETDERGVAILKLPSVGRYYTDDEMVTILAECAGHAPKVESVYWPDQECSFVLPKACSIFGRVLEFETQAPVSDARLIFGLVFWLTSGSPVEVVTDSEGWYRYDAVAPGAEETITVVREGFKFYQHSVEVGTASENRVDIFVPRGGSLLGRVVDGETGTALSNVRIGMHTPIAVTSASGRFVAQGLQESWFLTIRKASYCETTFLPWEDEIDESREVLIPMFRACSVEGTVLDAEGQPLAGASVWPEELGVRTVPEPLAERYRQYSWKNLIIYTKWPSPSLVTDDDGRFRFQGLKPQSRPVRLHTKHPAFDGTLHSEWLEFPSSGQSREIVLRYESGSSIQGVIRPAGTKWRVLWTSAGMRGISGAEADGSYRLIGVPAGEVRVDIMSPGNLSLEYVDLDQIVVSASVHATLGRINRHDFDVPPNRQGSSVGGTVVRLDGSPVSGADVEVYLPGRIAGSGVTDEHGRFEIEVMAESGSKCRLLCGSPLELRLEVLATIGEQDLVIVLPDEKDIRLRIVDEDTGLPLPRAEISWRMTSIESVSPNREGEPWEPSREGTGSIVLPIGTMTLTVEANSLGYHPKTEENFVVEDGATGAVRTIRMRRKR